MVSGSIASMDPIHRCIKHEAEQVRHGNLKRHHRKKNPRARRRKNRGPAPSINEWLRRNKGYWGVTFLDERTGTNINLNNAQTNWGATQKTEHAMGELAGTQWGYFSNVSLRVQNPLL